MKNLLLPYLRTAKLIKLRMQTRVQLAFPHPERDRLPVRFIVGCGRSGTTVLGRVISMNPRVHYLSEPYHLWQGIDPRMDVTGLHSSPDQTRFFLGADELTPEAHRNYDRLIARSGRASDHLCVIEKTPHNAGKLGWINAAEPDVRVLHIVRNGINVVRSIDRLASRPTYKLGFRAAYNQWWGEHGAKWKALYNEGTERGYFPDELDQLVGNDQKGAYEWLVSIGEVQRHRALLGDRLLEITYTQLTADPEGSCRLIAEHFGFPCTDEWINQTKSTLSPERVNKGDTLRLPQKMCDQFNAYQREYGFEESAACLAPEVHA